MLENIFRNLSIPLFIIINIMVTVEVANMVNDYIKRKKYTVALIITAITAALSWPTAIFIALYVGYKMAKENNNDKCTQNEPPKEPKPGSIEHYERWKAERECSGE